LDQTSDPRLSLQMTALRDRPRLTWYLFLPDNSLRAGHGLAATSFESTPNGI
jgi:hypothetical protein